MHINFKLKTKRYYDRTSKSEFDYYIIIFILTSLKYVPITVVKLYFFKINYFTSSIILR